MRWLAMAVLLAGLACAAVFATEDGPHWEALGPYYTDTRTVAVGPGADGPIFVDQEYYHMLWSTNGGRNWSRYGAPPGEFQHVEGLIADQQAPGRLLVATNKDVWESAGAGQTWQTLSGGVSFGGCFVRGAGGFLYGSRQDSVYRSRDGGRTWEVFCEPGPSPQLSASTTDAAHVMVSGGARVLVTRDGGVSWISSTPDPSLRWTYVKAVCLSPAYPDVAYAAVNALFRSVDGGRTWEAVPLPPEWGPVDVGAVPRIAASAQRPSLLLVSTGRGIIVGTEDGQSLTLERPKELQDMPVRDVAVNADATLACAATPKGVYVSRDRGKSWTVSIRGFPPVPVNRLTFLTGPDGGLIADGLRHGADGSWTPLGTGLGLVAIGGPQGRTLYAGLRNGLGKSTDYGKTWQKMLDPGLEGNMMDLVWAHGSLFVTGFDGPIMRGEDDGRTWQELPLRLPRSCYVAAVKPDPILADHLYLEVAFHGALDILVGRPPVPPGARLVVRLKLLRSQDGGKTWLDAPPPKEPWADPERYADHVAGSAAPGEVLYATPIRGYSVMPATIARSLDGGKSWEAFGDQAYLGGAGCLATEPSDTHVAYAGCGFYRQSAGRIFVTRDLGRTWEQLGPDLDTFYIYDILVRPGGEAALYVATGKGVQRLALPDLPAPEAPGAGR